MALGFAGCGLENIFASDFAGDVGELLV